MIFFLTLHSGICYSPDDLQAGGSIMITRCLNLKIVIGSNAGGRSISIGPSGSSGLHVANNPNLEAGL
jgi:hypothetical protein